MKSLHAALSLAAVLLLAGHSSVSAQTPQTEGQLVVYASHPSEMVDHFTKMFGDKYGIRVTSVKAGTGELLNRIKQTFPKVDPGNGYGMTETSALCTSNSAEEYHRRPDSVGCPAPVTRTPC